MYVPNCVQFQSVLSLHPVWADLPQHLSVHHHTFSVLATGHSGRAGHVIQQGDLLVEDGSAEDITGMWVPRPPTQAPRPIPGNLTHAMILLADPWPELLHTSSPPISTTPHSSGDPPDLTLHVKSFPAFPPPVSPTLPLLVVPFPSPQTATPLPSHILSV